MCCAGTPLVFRWNGAKWSRIATKLGKGAYLNGVAITGTNGAWAIGGPLAMITGALAKWNGSAWSWVTDPVPGAYRPFYGIATGPGGSAFVVGADNDFPLGPAISARWTGKAWHQVTVAAPNLSSLNAVSFAPGGAAWAAGSYPAGSRLAHAGHALERQGMDPRHQPRGWCGAQRAGVPCLELRVGGRQHHLDLRTGQDRDPALERQGLGLSPAASQGGGSSVRVSSLARIAVAASGICLTLATMVAGPARAGTPARGTVATAGSLTKAGPPTKALACARLPPTTALPDT